jgi:hypothetical protein
MRSSVGHEGSFGGNRERKKPGFLQRAAAGLAGLALALGGCSIGEAGAGASSSPEVTPTPDTTSTAEAAPTPTADRTPKMVAPGELPTIKQLSVENLEEDECIMYSTGAFWTEDGTLVSRPIVTVNGKLTTFGEEACNGGKVEVGKEDDVRYFVIVWEQEPGATVVEEVFAEDGENTYADTRFGRVLLYQTIQAVRTDGRDFTDWSGVTVTFTLQDGKIVPVACEYDQAASQGADPQTFVNSSNTELCRQ